jgi:hypothetical protein
LVGGLLGGSAYAIDTASQPHSGAIPTSGPRTGGVGGGFGGGGVGSEITAWVQSHYTATAIGGQTVYDLTS